MLAAHCILLYQMLAAPADVLPAPPAAQAPEKPWPSAAELRARRVASEGRPLFQDADPLAFTIHADFGQLNQDRDRARRRSFPGVLTVTAADGQTRSIPVTLRTRGKSRLNPRTCTFVPLRVEFPKEEMESTPFDGQEALKLVTHCRNDGLHEQYLLREYLAYRVLNVLTPRSFRARLARATYVDSVKDKTVATRPALWLESEKDVARRLEGRVTEMPGRHFHQLDAESLTLMMMFEYMIGNTDFSIYALHNVRLVRDATGVLYPVPYDFNNSGLVDAHYAIPSPRLPIKSVVERLYRGPCRSPQELEAVLARFRAAGAKVMDLFDEVPDLDKTHRRKAKSYLEDFYSTIGRAASVKWLFDERCRQDSGM
jgi:hypothetical protein